MKSKILPLIPILARRPLIQRIKPIPPAISKKTIMTIIMVMTLRFLDIGFLCFFLWCDCLGLVGAGSLVALSSPLISSKSKT